MRPLLLGLLLCLQHLAFTQKFNVSFSAAAFDGVFSGKLYLYLSKDNPNPKDGSVGFEKAQYFRVKAVNIKPGTSVTIDDNAVSYPVKLSDMERGEYYVQAVWDRNLGGRAISATAGNIYNKAIKVVISKDLNKTFSINCDKVIPEPSFKDEKFIQELKVPSNLLSAFHHKQVSVNGAVILPKDYFDNPGKKYPVLYIVFGYGGDYHRFSGDTVIRSNGLDSFPCITVYLDGNCPLGHSVYANSENNGPWGDALTKEFIPAVESRYRCDGARFLRGHSSGGWTVLWLQVHYPDVFAGCWSSSPDPVDFRNFQQINLYENENMFYNKDSLQRNVATVAGVIPWASMKQVYGAEHVIDRGEQMHSFDAVFSERGADGEPMRICDPVTGMPDKNVFEHWKNYDISNYLRTNWKELKNELDGKIRITVGDQDNFLLNHAVHLLDKEMKSLNANMEFEYFPGDHFTVSTPEYRKKGIDFLAGCYRAWLAKHPE